MIIRIRGILVDILVEIALDAYSPYVTTDKRGKKYLIVQCQNAIYGTMTASLLYYKNFLKNLIRKGFVFNPCDPCDANKIIQEKQMIIRFHVDDCKISYKNLKVVSKVIKWLRREYESIFEDVSGEMQVSRGKVHTYLGIKLEFTQRGRVIVSMFDYIEKIIVAFEKVDSKSKGAIASVVLENLYKVNEDCKKLSPTKTVEFYQIVVKTLYATKRVRPDTCMAVAFLTTRV